MQENFGIMGAVVIVVSFFIILFMLLAIKQIRSNKKMKNYKINLEQKEKLRGDFITDLYIPMNESELRKLGYPENFHGYPFLIKEKNGLLHFNYAGSPQLELLNIEYTPKFRTSSSKTEFGNNSTYDTNRVEIDSLGLLTFINVDNESKFNIKVTLNNRIYINLKSDFLKL